MVIVSGAAVDRLGFIGSKPPKDRETGLYCGIFFKGEAPLVTTSTVLPLPIEYSPCESHLLT